MAPYFCLPSFLLEMEWREANESFGSSFYTPDCSLTGIYAVLDFYLLQAGMYPHTYSCIHMLGTFSFRSEMRHCVGLLILFFIKELTVVIGISVCYDTWLLDNWQFSNKYPFKLFNNHMTQKRATIQTKKWRIIHNSQPMETAKMPHNRNRLRKYGIYIQWNFIQP
jgi:hypothetical protein